MVSRSEPDTQLSVERGVGSLDGRVHGCICPLCRAPMTIRLWLMTADCWRCGTSAALSYEDLRAALRGPRSAGDKPETPAAAPRIDPREHKGKRSAKEGREGQRSETPGAAASLWPAASATLRGPLAPPRAAADRALADEDQLLEPSGFRSLLAWLISAIVHLLMMILLGLLTTSPREKTSQLDLVLSVDFDRRRIEGELPNTRAGPAISDFDLPVARQPQTQRQLKQLQEADELARELRPDPNEPVPFMHKLNRTREDLRSRDSYRRMHATRDPRVRAEIVRQEGGTTLTEASVARALRWMARQPNDDGSWSIHAFHDAQQCRGRCNDVGRIRSDPGGTALALQAFLGAGQTHRSGKYRDVVAHGLQYLLRVQDDDGDLRGRNSDRQAGMYVHAQAAIVLCEAYKLTGDWTLHNPAQRAIDFLCSAQHRRGGWRYLPGQAGDTSVIGWQLMALHTAKAAYLDVPDDVLRKASRYLDRAQVDEDGALYAYQPGGGPTAAMTAEGLLSRMYLGWNRSDPGLQLGVAYLIEVHSPTRQEPNIYYWYYATQVMHHWGGRPWHDWNLDMRDILVTSQKTRGHEAGSWDPRTPHGHFGGRLYMTALACCTLEVYYRHAPLYRRIRLD